MKNEIACRNFMNNCSVGNFYSHCCHSTTHCCIVATPSALFLTVNNTPMTKGGRGASTPRIYIIPSNGYEPHYIIPSNGEERKSFSHGSGFLNHFRSLFLFRLNWFMVLSFVFLHISICIFFVHELFLLRDYFS